MKSLSNRTLLLACALLCSASALRLIDSSQVPEAVGTKWKAGSARKLVFDIGLNRGDDTRAYLDKGYRVLAVEASPVWYARNAERFSSFIDDGRLVIENKILSPELGQTAIFHIPQVKAHVSEVASWLTSRGLCRAPGASLSAQNSEKPGDCAAHFEHIDEFASASWYHACELHPSYYGGARMNCSDANAFCECRKMTVPSTTCQDLISTYGTPYYLKIDIEGFDGLCMRSLLEMPCASLPDFITFEEQSVHPSTVASSKDLIRAFSKRGYVWKVSQQHLEDHAALGTGPFGEDAQDYVHGHQWSDGTEAEKQANYDCWQVDKAPPGTPAKYDCDVHGKILRSQCVEPIQQAN